MFTGTVLLPLLCGLMHDIDSIKPQKRKIDSLELFAGQAEYSDACARLGMNAVAYDVEYSGYGGCNDIMSDIGFNRALKLVLQLKPHATLLAAVVCSSWVWIGRLLKQ